MLLLVSSGRVIVVAVWMMMGNWLDKRAPAPECKSDLDWNGVFMIQHLENGKGSFIFGYVLSVSR